ncbi:MAG: hypothetical protein P8130_13965 [Deltaproteobacteria bacterium]
MVDQRKISIVTSPGKKYTGMIDVPNAALRTTDLLNSGNIFWKDPSEKCLDDVILLYDVHLQLDDNVFRKFDKIQIKISEIIFFYDEQEHFGDEREKKRASLMLEKAKSKDKFIPLTSVTIQEIFKTQGKWHKKEIALPYKFIGISNGHIESITTSKP